MPRPVDVQSQIKPAPALDARAAAWFPVLLAGVVLVLYGPSVRFGLMWDDPDWYQQGAGRSIWQVFTSPNTYQFYRPLTILFDRQFVSAAGVVNAPLAHAVHIGVHLAATLLSLPVLRALKFSPWHARLTALLFAVYPLSYQAVAWQAPQQPLAMIWVLLAVWAADGYLRRRRAALLALSGAAYAVALLFQESALPFVFLFFWLAGADQGNSTEAASEVIGSRGVGEASAGRVLFGARSRWLMPGGIGLRPYLWPLLHLTVALLYAAAWLNIPHQGGVTGTGFQLMALAYLLQGVAFLPAHLAAGWISGWPTAWLVFLFALIGLALAAGAWKSQGRNSAILSCLWIGAGLLPPWAGLSWDYVQIGSRLMYPAALGVAGLWGAWAAWAFSQRRGWPRMIGWAILALLLWVSLQQWYQFQRLFQNATEHLAAAVQTLTRAAGERVLFVNFPDRVEVQPAPYPLGVWGVPLAPVVQNLSDFARAEQGASAEDRSRAAFRVGAVERVAWPYRVAMRGADSDPAALFEQARWADQVYLSDYLPDGSLRLRAAGHIRPRLSATPPLARVDAGVELGGAELSQDTGLALTWRVLKPLGAEDTIFVHFWKEGVYVAAQDGDSLAGLIPPAAWQPGTEVVDIRPVQAAGLGPGRYEVRVGLYNRQDGARYPAYSAGGDHFPEDEIPVGALIVP